jgi:pyruvyl transferase EpsO
MTRQPISGDHERTMTGLKQRLYEVKEIIGPYESMAYLDYPIHLNTGDLLIMKGTEAFFSHFGMKPAVRKSVAAQARTDGFVHGVSEKSTTIVFHGGGNLGDLYPLHNNFRNLVINRYPDNKIVILPQTLHFSSKEKLKGTAAIYRQHPNIHLCVRDHASLKIASEYLSDHVYLVPDMAHFLWPLASGSNTNGHLDTLFLIRGDKESAGIPNDFSGAHPAFRDWNDLRSARDVLVEGLCKKMCALDRTAGTRIFPVTEIWYSFVDRFIARQSLEFLQYRKIVTSRLHGHIFATLLGIPNVLIDNSYGKNKTYFDAWTSTCGIAELR